MLTTTHYGLNIVEGTDVVNPLVQQNPNYTAIDAAMYANKQGSIGSGTELTSGTVHTITRANPDSNYVRFTATSNWTAGDSMVVDSTPVSVYLSDGTTPATGAYVINTEVLILVNGSRVTLLASGYKEAKDRADAAYTLANTANGKADNLEGDADTYVGAETFNITLKRVPALIMFRPSGNNIRAFLAVTDGTHANVLYEENPGNIIINSQSGNVLNITTLQPCAYAVLY